jgi:hypothetical protein
VRHTSTIVCLYIEDGVSVGCVCAASRSRATSRWSRPWCSCFSTYGSPTRCRYIFEFLVGENIHRYPMSLTNLECQESELVHSDTCPRPTAKDVAARAAELAARRDELTAAEAAAGAALERINADSDADAPLGLGSIVALYCRSSTSYRIR